MLTSLICVDANIIIRLVMDPDDQEVWALWNAWFESGATIIAPALLYYEVTNAIYLQQRLNGFSAEAGAQALATAQALPVRLHAEAHLHAGAMLLAQRFALPATYAAHYLAMAEAFDAVLWTADRKLVKAVGDELPWVKLIESV
jgi:predicted nucleic acid-binding protein